MVAPRRIAHLDNVVVGKLVPALLQCLGWGRRELPKRARAEDPNGAPRVEGGLELGLGASLGLLVRPALVLEQQLPLGPPFRLGDGSSFPLACLAVRSFYYCFVFAKALAHVCVMCSMLGQTIETTKPCNRSAVEQNNTRKTDTMTSPCGFTSRQHAFILCAMALRSTDQVT